MTRARHPFVAVLIALFLLAPAGTASAHDQLLGSDPEDGAVVEAPDELELEFSGQLSELGLQVVVTDPDGRSVVDGEPEVDGRFVTQDLVDDLGAGTYDVVWRVTSEDGHPISGELSFTVEVTEEPTTEEPTTAAPTTVETSEPVETSEEPTETAAEETTSAEPTATAEPTEDATTGDEQDAVADEGGLPVWAWVIIGLAVVGLLGLLARTWGRGRTDA